MVSRKWISFPIRRAIPNASRSTEYFHPRSFKYSVQRFKKANQGLKFWKCPYKGSLSFALKGQKRGRGFESLESIPVHFLIWVIVWASNLSYRATDPSPEEPSSTTRFMLCSSRGPSIKTP